MSAIATDNFVLNKATAAEFLVNGSGGAILLKDISWEEYELFLEDFAEKSGWRLAYDTGNLEIMPPTFEHEFSSFSLGYFVSAYCEEFELEFVGAGSTTFRRAILKKGVEPDECFYIQSADQLLGKAKLLDPKNYPMPDVAVEIDITHGSLDKFSIYAMLGIPEIWLYDGENLTFFELEDLKYLPISKSIALPLLSAEKLTEFVNLTKTKGQLQALKSFRQYLNELKMP